MGSSPPAGAAGSAPTDMQARAGRGRGRRLPILPECNNRLPILPEIENWRIGVADSAGRGDCTTEGTKRTEGHGAREGHCRFCRNLKIGGQGLPILPESGNRFPSLAGAAGGAPTADAGRDSGRRLPILPELHMVVRSCDEGGVDTRVSRGSVSRGDARRDGQRRSDAGGSFSLMDGWMGRRLIPRLGRRSWPARAGAGNMPRRRASTGRPYMPGGADRNVRATADRNVRATGNWYDAP